MKKYVIATVSSTRVKGAATRHASQAAEKVIYIVIPSEARNLSLFKAKKREIPRRAARLGMTKI
jgi:hypothetical protein